MSNETVKRHHPQQQPPEVFDPNIPLDTELLFKDPLKPKESEHEQEWKFRQVRVYAMKSVSRMQRQVHIILRQLRRGGLVKLPKEPHYPPH